jgi:hypothetical protein
MVMAVGSPKDTASPAVATDVLREAVTRLGVRTMKARYMRLAMGVATVVSFVLVLGAPARSW